MLRVPKTPSVQARSVFILVQEAAEVIASADVQVCDCGWIGDRLGERVQRPGIRDAPMRPVRVVATRSRTL